MIKSNITDWLIAQNQPVPRALPFEYPTFQAALFAMLSDKVCAEQCATWPFTVECFNHARYPEFTEAYCKLVTLYPDKEVSTEIYSVLFDDIDFSIMPLIAELYQPSTGQTYIVYRNR